jgi:FkbM family methyltransferase
MSEKLTNYINDKKKEYIIFDIGSRDCQQSIEFYKTFPNAKIYAFACNPNTLDLCEQNIIPYKDRITLIKGSVCNYEGLIDICYINDNDYKYIEDRISVNRIKILGNSNKILFNNLKSNLEMFCIYHKKYYFREDNFYFTFFGVNEVYSKKKTYNNILEYKLDKYNPLLQKRGYMETSVYLHVYWNKLYKNKDMVGFSQYDMKHSQIYNNLDKKTIYLLNTNKKIVRNGKWDPMMFPKIRNLDFLIKSYNSYFNKSYSIKQLENKPLSLRQTNIYPVKIYEKLCGWLEKLVDEIYPWSNQPPYETHFGSIGGYTERALSIFNAFEIYEGTSYSNLNIQHGVGVEEKEQYNHKSFLNNYSQDVHCKIVEEADDIKDYSIVGIDNQNDSIIKKNINGITQLFYLDEQGNRSKPLMIIGNNSDNTFKWKHNILDCDLDDYEIYYKKINYRYDIIICKKKHITYKETIRHFVSKDQLKIPKNKFSNELKQRWGNHEYKTNKKILSLIDNIDIEKKLYILDAGSHVGDTLFMISLYLKKKQLTKVKVIGIEPDEEKVSFIQDIIQLNHINNIQLKCSAISDVKGMYSINKNNRNSGAWTLEPSRNSVNDGRFVRLDEICKDKSMYFIHLDVEGYEIKALNSGKETIKNTPHIILEYEHIGLNKIKSIMPPDTKYEIIDAGDVYIKNVKNFDAEYLVTEIDGIKFAVYKNDTHISKALRNGNYWEKNLLNFMIEECYKYSEGTILDIGANIGSLSIPIAHKYPHLTVIALEAETKHCQLINKSKELNKLNNLTVYNYCISDKDNILMYGPNINFSTNGNYGGSVMSEDKNDLKILQGTQINGVKKWITNSKIIGKSKTIDSFNFKNIIFMKIDVEGFENKVMTGAINSILKYKPTITAEYLNNESPPNDSDFYKQMTKIGYKKTNKFGNDIVFTCDYKYKITCFSYSNNNNVYDITFPTIQAYCEGHDYQFIPYHTNLENKYKPHWNKLHYSIKLLKENNSEYIVWFDHDIVIKNYNIKLEDIITKYKFNQSNALFMMSQDPASHHPFNTGVIVFKNNRETLNIFQKFLEMRNNPHKYELLNKYGGFNFNRGMQDTRVMLAYFHANKDTLLSIPHKVLQSFYGQAEFYSAGDFCGHVAGPQGERLISKLNELKNYENFDIVIPVGPNDKSVIEQQIKYTKKNIIGYRNIYLICYDPSIVIDGCITINENIFPFNIDTVAKHHGKLDRNGWYLQQLLKLYAGKIIPNILDKYLVIDSDTFFLKPTTFVKDNKCLYNYGTEYHKPYFHHMKNLDKDLTKVDKNKSGICHHMIFDKKYIDELISKIEKNHNELFYNIFLKTVTNKKGSGASEYEIYFNYMLKYHPDKIQIRKLSWTNTNKLESNSNYDYISYHWYMR